MEDSGKASWFSSGVHANSQPQRVCGWSDFKESFVFSVSRDFPIIFTMYVNRKEGAPRLRISNRN